MDRGIRSECISPPTSKPTQKNVVPHVLVCKPAVPLAQGAWCARFVVVRRRARENTSVSMSSLSPPMARARRFMSRGAMHGKGSARDERTGGNKCRVCGGMAWASGLGRATKLLARFFAPPSAASCQQSTLCTVMHSLSVCQLSVACL